MILNEGFSLVRDSVKIFEYRVSLRKEKSDYIIMLNDSKEVRIQSDDEQLVRRFAISELNNVLANCLGLIKEESDVEILTFSQNESFIFRPIRCENIRTKGPLRGEKCNKFLVGTFTDGRLGGRVHCPRCQKTSYI